MSASSHPLSNEKIKEINDEALAAVERGRAMIARSREFQEKSGLRPEKIRQAFNSLPAPDRAWINTAVNAGLASLTQEPVPVSTGKRRKMRTTV
jgi:hypothetical protein